MIEYFSDYNIIEHFSVYYSFTDNTRKVAGYEIKICHLPCKNMMKAEKYFAVV